MLREGLFFATHDGVELRGDLYLPHPALVAAPGGAWLRGDRKGLSRWGEYLSARGIAVFSVDYRRSTAGRIFPENVRDVAAAARFVSARSGDLDIDPARIGLLGASAGGHLTALAALAGDTPVARDGYPNDVGAGTPLNPKVLVTVYGVFDLAAHWQADSVKPAGPDGDVTERMLGGTPGDNAALYRLASPVTHVLDSASRPPVLVVWGDSDVDVLPAQSQTFAKALAEAGYPTQTLPVEGAGHFWFSKDEINSPFNAFVASQLMDFLKANLVA